MIEYLKQLAELRKEVQHHTEVVAKYQMNLESTAEWGMVDAGKTILKAKKAAQEAMEKDIKSMAINILKDNPLAELAAGLIKKTKTIYAYAKEEAEAWAKTNAPYLFVFDEGAFKEVAKGKNAPAFVTVTKEPDVQLASDLSAYLEDEEQGHEKNLD